MPKKKLREASDETSAQVIVYVCGDAGSGKSYALNYINKAFKESGCDTRIIQEDTTPFYESGAATYDSFCKLPVSFRKAASLKVYEQRIARELVAYNNWVPKEGALRVVIEDRPSWDSFYYMFSRSRKFKGLEGDVFTLIDHMIFRNLLSPLPPSADVVFLFLSPLSPNLLSDAHNVDSRPLKLTKQTLKYKIDRLIDFTNYLTFQLFMIDYFKMKRLIGTTPVLTFETSSIRVPEGIAKRISKDKGELKELIKTKMPPVPLLLEFANLVDANEFSRTQLSKVTDELFNQVVISDLELRDLTLEFTSSMLTEAFKYKVSKEEEKEEPLVLTAPTKFQVH